MLNSTKKAASLHNEHLDSVFKTNQNENQHNDNIPTLISNHNNYKNKPDKLFYQMDDMSSSEEDSTATASWPKLSLHEFSVKLLSIFSGSVSPLSTKYSSNLNETPSLTKNNMLKDPVSWPTPVSTTTKKIFKTKYLNSNSNLNNNYKNNFTNRIKSYKLSNTMPYEQKQEHVSTTPFSAKVKLLSSLSTPSIIFLGGATSSKSLGYSTPYNHHITYKNNELYSILVSMFTAALFLLFIMWRWFRMKSDLRKALREQLEIQQLDEHNSSSSSRRTTPSSSSSSSNHGGRWSSSHHHHFRHHNQQFQHHNRLLNSAKRQQLQATAASIIAQLANGEHRTPEEHQQMINTAKCCLQQLKAHARLISHNHTNRLGNRENEHLNNFYMLNARYDGQLSPTNLTNSNNLGNTVELSCSRNMPLLVGSTTLHPTNNSSLQMSELFSSTSSIGGDYASMGYQQRTAINENPPSYESIIKSSSLPSYCHFSTTDEKTSRKN